MSAKSCSSSSGTTPLRPDGGSAGWTWCFAPPNALFFRRRAPRLWSKIGFQPVGRGASLPPMPCSFVAGHHVFGTKWGFGRLGVVLRFPQCPILSSSGTTSLEQNRASAGWPWCFAPRNTLFFRRRAPRLWSKIGFRPVGRGASLPPMPCSFVAGHHVFGAKSDFSRLGVVLHSPQSHVLPSTGTTSLEQNRIRPVERGASLPAMPCSFVA